VIYALCPTIIANLPIGWLVVAKSVTGANFAGVAVLLNLLVLEVFGAADFATVYPYIGLATGLGFTTGPLTGYYLHMARTGDNGGEGSSDCNAFFLYVCGSHSSERHEHVHSAVAHKAGSYLVALDNRVVTWLRAA